MVKFAFQPLEPRLAAGERVGLGEAVTTGFQNARLLGLAGEGQRHAEAYGSWKGIFDGVIQGRVTLPEDLGKALVDQGFSPDEYTLGRLGDWVKSDGAQYGFELTDDMDPAAVMARRDAIWQRDQQTIEANQEKLTRASQGSALFGQIVGGVGAEFLDPINLLTMPIGAPARVGFLGTVAIEAAINAGIEAAETGTRNRIAEGLGQEATSALENAFVGALFGGAMVTGMKGVQLAARGTQWAGGNVLARIGRTLPAVTDPRDVARGLAKSADPIVRQMAGQVIRDIDDAERAGALTSPEAELEHEDRIAATVEAMVNEEPVRISDRPFNAIPRSSILNGAIEEVDPKLLEVQPDVFQFKSDADAEGVTAKLRDVPEWRPERAGVVLVYEYADGRQAIADGHQRTALARRIMETDPSQEIKLAATVFRETDGFTPEAVRVIAALKNISEAADGMTMKMARDAAKVLRIDPEAVRSLPAGSGIARAQNLAALSDDAFALVINEVVPDRYAAIVGRLVPDPGMQMAVMRLLERTNPASEAQAEAIVRQALAAPVSKEVTEDLFGSQEITESLFIERAKVLERAMRILREDAQTFRVLTERQQSIEGAGANRLDKVSNADQRKLVDEALYSMEKLAYRAGAISEALDNGARSYKESGRLKDAAGAVVDAIRNELRGNGPLGAGARDAGRDAKLARSSQSAPDPNQGFDDPIAGPGAASQIAATRLDVNERPAEAFSSDLEARRDLGRRISAGATREEIDKHPAVVKALEDLERRAADATHLREAYGSEKWHSAREYLFKDPDTGLEIVVTGTENALPFWAREAEAFAGPEGPARERLATIVLGPPAAGKSTIAEELALVKRAAILDSDEIKKTLPEYEGGIGAAQIHEESADLADDLEAILQASGTNVIFPKVGKDPKSIRATIARFREAGYKVELVDMAVTAENAYKRMIGRFVAKGRLIPPAFVDMVGEKPRDTYRVLKEEGVADGYAEIDNNGGPNDAKPVLDLAGENPLLGSRFDLPVGRGADGAAPEPGSQALPRADGEPKVEQTPAGSQLLLDGIAPITARERIQAAADRPLLSQTRTSDSQIGGLFDAGDPARSDLFDQVPVGVREVDGVRVAETVSRAELEAELAADDEFADQLGLCLK